MRTFNFVGTFDGQPVNAEWALACVAPVETCKDGFESIDPLAINFSALKIASHSGETYGDFEGILDLVA